MKILNFIGAAILAASLSSCSALSNFYSSASSFPSAATLTASCQAGLAKTPAVRDNACDLYDAVAKFCAGQSNLPMNAVQACSAAGYAISGSPTIL